MSQNAICWFEIYVKDMDRAKKFYSTVLGNTFFDMDAPGDAAGTMKMSFFSSPQESDPNSVSGALVEMPGTKDGDNASLNTIVYFPCNDCAVEESRVAAAGGSINQSKMNIGEFGFCSICVDTEGNAFGLFSMQ